MHGPKADFRFAGLTAGVLLVAMIVISLVWDLPVRDPDGVTQTYFLLPLIIIAAILVDVLPRAVWRSRRSLGRTGHEIVAVTRQRWPWSHLRFALTGLFTWYLSYAAFRNLKSYVPFVNDRLYDRSLGRFDQVLLLGNDPAVVLHQVFGTGWAAYLFSFVYVAWIALVPVSLAVALVWSRRPRAGSWYVTAIAVDWALGVAVYFVVPSLGPAYSSPSHFTGLPHTWVTGLVSGMMEDRQEVLRDPFATHQVQTIAAFASLHVAIAVTACLMTYLLGLPRFVQIASWVFLALTEVATMYFGWHFFVDTLAGAVLGAAAVWIAALGTGNHRHGIPVLVDEQVDPVLAPAGQPSSSQPSLSQPSSGQPSAGQPSAPRSRPA